MFSGIIEAVGRVAVLEERGVLKTLTLSIPLTGFEIGDSLAVNGCCLTIRSIDGEHVTVDLIPETLEKTNLKDLKIGSNVNLERPLTLQKGINGHLVQGHVDDVGIITKMEPLPGDGWFVEVKSSDTIADLLIDKGSVTVDGVSLTVIEVKGQSFTYSLIPHTAIATTLGEKKIGDHVNLEGDLIAKYMKKWVR